MNCPLCQPQSGVVFEDDHLLVIEVPGAELPGSMRVIWKTHAQEMTDLSPVERSHCMRAVCRVEDELRKTLSPDKINLASFGNMVPHLHWHVMARWRTDPWWPQPTWTDRKPVATTPMSVSLRGHLGDWASLRDLAAPVRHAVFVEEQGVPAEEEWDLADRYCRHVLIEDSTQTPPEQAGVATGRLLPNGRIGRMAVRQDHRQSGLGGWVLHRLMQEAKALGMAEVSLHAQEHALGFYARHGFVAEGPVFMECEIPHRQMRRALDDL